MIPSKILSPSILNADFTQLGEQISMTSSGGAHWLHLDIMDGHFVPNISFGPSVVQSIRKATDLPLDCHLMILNAEDYIPEFAKAGANNITVHYEATSHLDRQIQLIKSFGCTAGVSINPATDVKLLEPILPLLDMVLIMTINPGFGGQELMPYCVDKIKWLKEKRSDLMVQVDGGVKISNIQSILDAGANNFVVGSGIFGQADVKKATQNFVEIITA